MSLLCAGAGVYYYNQYLRAQKVFLEEVMAGFMLALSVAAFILACWSGWVMRRFAALSAPAANPDSLG